MVRGGASGATVLYLSTVWAGRQRTDLVSDPIIPLITTTPEPSSLSWSDRLLGAQAAVQTQFDDAYADLEATGNKMLNSKEQADSADKVWSKCIAEQKIMVKRNEDSQRSVKSANKNTKEACQSLEDHGDTFTYEAPSQVANWELHCSHADNSCTAGLREYQQMLEKESDSARAKWREHLKKHNQLKGKCTDLQHTARRLQKQRRTLQRRLAEHSSQCRAKNEDRIARICEFGKYQQAKCAGEAAFEQLAKGRGTTIHQQFQELALLQPCKEVISFFDGKTWNVPASATASSFSYTRSDFHPTLVLDLEKPAFDFCEENTTIGSMATKAKVPVAYSTAQVHVSGAGYSDANGVFVYKSEFMGRGWFENSHGCVLHWRPHWGWGIGCHGHHRYFDRDCKGLDATICSNWQVRKGNAGQKNFPVKFEGLEPVPKVV